MNRLDLEMLFGDIGCRRLHDTFSRTTRRNYTEPAEAEKFLDLIAGKPGERFMFRVIAERSDLKATLAEKAKLENRKLDDLLADDKPGTLSQLLGWLVKCNAFGWAVYVVINETTGIGDEDVVRVRAHFSDFDEIFRHKDQCNERRKRLRRFNELAPTSMAVSSSPNKLHTYWLTQGAPLENFKHFQRRIAEFFGNDPVISNLSRIMRLPGFLHQKKGPYLTRIAWRGNPGPIEASCLETALDQCLRELGPWPYAATKTKTKPGVAKSGTNGLELVPRSLTRRNKEGLARL